jgi:F0F1-type ATP synthase assembly protein I
VRSDAVSDVTESGRRLVTRTVLLQAAGSLLVAALFLLAGLAQARAALTGGMIVTIGTAILGRRMFAAGVVPGEVLVAGSLLGTALRWMWLVGAMWCALALLHLPALPLVCGLAAAYVAFGLATLRNK